MYKQKSEMVAADSETERDGKIAEILFFEHNPYMSVELLDLLKNFKIICYNDDATYRHLCKYWHIGSYLNTDFHNEPESDRVAEILLGDQSFLDQEVGAERSGKVLFFYMNAEMNRLCSKAGLSMLLPNYELQAKLGDKTFLARICEQLGLAVNKCISYQQIPDDFQLLFQECKVALSAPFIIQDAFGESGWDTALIYNTDDLQKALARIKHGLRATRFIKNNIPISVHICITEKDILIRGPWLQLIGLPELASGKFRYSGNDTEQSFFTNEFINNVKRMSRQIAEFVRQEGYMGILGVDYLWDKDENIIYPQEINSRIVGATRLLTGIQKDQLLIPDLLKHIETFALPSYSNRYLELRDGEIDLINHNYSQIIIRNNQPHPIQIFTRLDPGIYREMDGVLVKSNDSLFVRDMRNDEVLITAAAHAGCRLTTGEAIVRLILKKSVIKTNEYRLSDDAVRLIAVIRKQCTLPTI